jgi:uncharacterized protein (DUF1778 family)
MSALPNTPSSRLDFRISPEHKALIERAASAQGQTVSNFAISTLLKAAEEAIHSETMRVLSARDGRRFLALIDAVPAPNAALKAAAARYRESADKNSPAKPTRGGTASGDTRGRRASKKGGARRER